MRRPIHGCVGAGSAFVGTIILAVGIGQLISPEHGRGIGLFFVGWGVLMWFPVFARAPENLRTAEEDWRRFRLPTVLCLCLGLLINGIAALVIQGVFSIHDARRVAIQLGAIGSALWLVGLVLGFFMAYHRSQMYEPPENIDDDGAA